MTLGTMRIAGPATWKVERLLDPPGQPGGSYRVDVPGKCTGGPDTPNPAGEPGYAYTLHCPSFALLDRKRINPPEGRPGTFKLDSPYHPAGDISHECPPDAAHYGGITGPDVLLASRKTPVGSQQAEYREWRRTCKDYTGKYTGKPTFVQRVWFLPKTGILIVDEWNTPNLAGILAKATWL